MTSFDLNYLLKHLSPDVVSVEGREGKDFKQQRQPLGGQCQRNHRLDSHFGTAYLPGFWEKSGHLPERMWQYKDWFWL